VTDIPPRYPAGCRTPAIDGSFRLVYEPDPKRPNHWFVNDHCLVRDSDGRVHYFGIENPYPTTEAALAWTGSLLEDGKKPFIHVLHGLMHGHLYNPHTHFGIGHAVADNIMGPWIRKPPALDGRARNHHYGSPFVVKHEGRYWMFLPEGPSGDDSSTGICVSEDLGSWRPMPDGTAWNRKEVFGASGHRDPCIIRLADGRFAQFFAGALATEPKSRQTVNVAVSRDLKHWEAHPPCLETCIPKAPFSGVLESPFVLEHGGMFYLFVCFAHRRYYETLVYVSDDPMHFEPENPITTLFTHAPELIEIDGRVFISSCGIEDPQCLNRSGLWVAPLQWFEARS